MTQRLFAYPAKVERDGSSYVLSFRDVPEALGQVEAVSGEELMAEAQDTVMIALDYYFKNGTRIPEGSASEKGEMLVDLPLSYVSKIILHNTMIANKVRPSALARRLGIPTSEVARITNPRFKTKIDTMSEAIFAAGGSVYLSY